MNRFAHLVLMLALPVAAGVAVSCLASVAETLVRTLNAHPAVVDDASLRAKAIVGPLLFPVFVILCWAYVLPVSWLLRRIPLLAAAMLVTLPVWGFATFVLHEPVLDSILATVADIGFVVGLPFFSAALVAGAVLRPNQWIKPPCSPPASTAA